MCNPLRTTDVPVGDAYPQENPVPRPTVDPSTSLERKLRDFGATLQPEEKEIFNEMLLMVTTAEDPEVSGFAVGRHGPSGAETSMIDLQSVMSQRQLAFQMSTSLLAATNESSKSIIGNIGR